MWQPQRLYVTNLDSQIVKEEILKNRDKFVFFGDEKVLDFRLKEFPGNLLQLSALRHIFSVHGTKPHEFLLDMRIARTLAQELRGSYPQGISFKLHKETIRHYGQNSLLFMEGASAHWHKRAYELLRDGGEERFQVFLKAIRRVYETDGNLRNQLAEKLNHAFAEGLAQNGFLCLPSGELSADDSGLFAKRAPEVIEKCIRVVQNSGFL